MRTANVKKMNITDKYQEYLTKYGPAETLDTFPKRKGRRFRNKHHRTEQLDFVIAIHGDTKVVWGVVDRMTRNPQWILSFDLGKKWLASSFWDIAVLQAEEWGYL